MIALHGAVVFAQDVTFTIDAAHDRHAIAESVYGANELAFSGSVHAARVNKGSLTVIAVNRSRIDARSAHFQITLPAGYSLGAVKIFRLASAGGAQVNSLGNVVSAAAGGFSDVLPAMSATLYEVQARSGFAVWQQEHSAPMLPVRRSPPRPLIRSATACRTFSSTSRVTIPTAADNGGALLISAVSTSAGGPALAQRRERCPAVAAKLHHAGGEFMVGAGSRDNEPEHRGY